MTATEIAAAVREGRVSALEVTHQALRLAKSVGRDLNAFITICEDKALKQARAVDRAIKDPTLKGGAPDYHYRGRESDGDIAHPDARGLWPPLAGVPVALKDNICYRDYPTTCASRMLGDFISPYDATIVNRLMAAGAILIGKTNMDEFGMGSSTEFSCFGPTRNPTNCELVPGGSSGGSAAAVAAGIIPIAFGSDTGGSIRQPAAFCGILGMKPSYGAVSRYGLVAFASSLDQIGPLARNPEDLALALQSIMGHDPRDTTSSRRGSADFTGKLSTDRKFRIGFSDECSSEDLDQTIVDDLEVLRTRLERAGHSCRTISLSLGDKAIAAYYLIANAEASSNLARYDGVRYGLREKRDDLKEMYAATRSVGFGEEVKRRIMMGTYTLSAGYGQRYYERANRVRELIQNDFQRVFESVDLILSPTTPSPAFPIGEKVSDPISMYLSDIYTVSANLARLPAISIPLGDDTGRRCLSAVQAMAPEFGELKLLQFAWIVADLEES